ncbi:MsnO8 family LLM class oxidoreductase [Actinoplanes sp. TBRC 11911]|nr:MsnO8 family LLM class oxidoreductase [Actinoplanes sp. TBRC 11911]
MDIPVSALELLAVDTATPALDVAGVIDVAQGLQRSGYRRVWYAEHHASAHMIAFPPAVVAARVASATTDIRVGTGGVLAVNHAPLALAEQFAALTAFFPGRIDLGVGRGPGTYDKETVRALRQGRDPATDDEYEANLAELLRLASEHPVAAEPWLLASSPNGAAVAARLGLPMAFAHHLRPQNTPESVERYRREFRPSRWSDTPRLMLSVAAFCAEDEAHAAYLARPLEFLRARIAGGQTEVPIPDPATAASYEFTPDENAAAVASREHVAQGTPDQVRARLTEMAGRFGADELIVWSMIVDAKDRARSYELIMQS